MYRDWFENSFYDIDGLHTLGALAIYGTVYLTVNVGCKFTPIGNMHAAVCVVHIYCALFFMQGDALLSKLDAERLTILPPTLTYREWLRILGF